MNQIIYCLLIIYSFAQDIDIIGYETNTLIYEGTVINLVKCKLESSTYLIGIQCIYLNKAFIISKEYFSTFIQNSFELSVSKYISILSDDNFVDISSNNSDLIISSNMYYYLFSFESVSKYKKIKFEYNSSYKITQTIISHSIIGSVIQSNDYPYDKLFYIMQFNYDNTSNVLYYKTSSPLKINSIAQNTLISYYISDCSLYISTSSSLCLITSNIDLSKVATNSTSTQYVVLIAEGENNNMKLTLIHSQITCGYEIERNDDIVFTVCSNQSLIYYNTRDNQNEKGTLSVYGNKLKLVNQYDNSYLVLIANIESGIVYICSLTVSKIYINPTIKEENIIYIRYDNDLLYGDNRYRISALYYTNKLLFWIDTNSIDSVNTSLLYYPNYLITPICDMNAYYDKSQSICVNCSNNQISKSLRSEQCEECSNTYCPSQCNSLNTFGSNCLSCESYLSEELNVNTDHIVSYSKDEICEFYCEEGYMKQSAECVVEPTYNEINETNSFDSSSNDTCLLLTSCYDCYKNSQCEWCENSLLCKSKEKASNCDISNAKSLIANSDMYINQYLCINYNDISSVVHHHSNSKKSINITISNDTNDNDIHYQIHIFGYSSIKTIEISILESSSIKDLSIVESYTSKPSSLYSTKRIKSDYFYIMISYTSSSTLSISVSIKFSLSTSIIIIIVIASLIVISVFIVSLVTYIRRKRAQFSKNQLELNQPKKNTYKHISSKSSTKTDLELASQPTSLMIKLSSIPTFRIDDAHSNIINYICDYCKIKFEINDKIAILTCDHVMHYRCLYNQVINNNDNLCSRCHKNIINAILFKEK